MQSWPEVREIFERALDLPAGERASFVDRETTGHGALRSEVMRLLDHCRTGEGFLTPPETGNLLGEVHDCRPAPGDRIGSYRIERLLGEGGMGVVYLARQERPSRNVALKLMHARFSSGQAKLRFEFEVEVLGRLRHPGIAAIHEMSVHRTPDGGEVPFFAMEYVEGARDLLSYADQERLDLRARIELFRGVCAAVHHAHQKGVIHRDLKPGNILVDAAGQSKVIDYGVARAIDREPAEGLRTQAGFLLGTLQYLSPEQLSSGSDEVDTRSDVYALGVILYELVAGRPPYEVTGPIAEVVAGICERMPRPPSAYACDLPREIDWIVLRALSKERERRYGSADELALDLGRHLGDEPVSAGPPTARYRLKKLVVRHKLAVTGAALVLASLIGGIVALRIGLVEARAGRKDAETAEGVAAKEAARAGTALRRQTAVLDALADIIAAVHPDEDGRKVTLFELLERKRPQLDQELADDPDLRAALEDFLATAYYSLGLIEPAAELSSSAIGTLESLPDPDPSQLARLRGLLGRLLMAQGRLDEAQAVLDASVLDLERAGTLESSPGLYALRSRALLLESRNHLPESVDVYRDLVVRAERALAPSDPDYPIVPTVMSELGTLLESIGKGEEGEQWARLGHERAQTSLGPVSPFATIVQMRLGCILQKRGKNEEAVPLLRDALERMTEVFGEAHTNTLQARGSLARALTSQGELDEAEELARGGLALTLEHHPHDSLDLEVEMRSGLAHVLEARGEKAELSEQLEAAIRRLEAAGLPDHPSLAVLRKWLGAIDPAVGR